MASTPDIGHGSRRRKARRERTSTDGSPGQSSAPPAIVRCALALEAAGVGAFEWDSRSGVLRGSEIFVALVAGRARPPLTLPELLAAAHADDRAALEREMRGCVAERRAGQAEYRVMDEAGVRWISARMGVVCDSRGELTNLVGIVEDVTTRKLAEAEHVALVRRERELRVAAEQANLSKDEFLSMFSHELRSPLNAILGWNSILAAKRAGDAEIAQMTARIERSAKAQLKLVNDLLDLGRISTGKLKIEPRPIKLATVVAAALDATRPAAAAKSIELATTLAPSGTDVYGDPDRLQQVVWNLLANAVKFTDPGGRIGVSVCAVDVVVELSIADTGHGISPEFLPHVFDRFRQGDSSTTRQASGLGLGLALVREIVALHGGSVSAASAGAGFGATFTVLLPALRVRQAAQVVDAVQPPGLAFRPLDGLSILVVDDEVDARTVVAETLRLEGARVTVSASAAEALRQLHCGDARYDVVITDIGMPSEDGYSLVRKLRRAPFGEQVLAIALTGYASPRDRDAALRAGFDVHIAKPVDFDRFVPLIARMMRSVRRARDH